LIAEGDHVGIKEALRSDNFKDLPTAMVAGSYGFFVTAAGRYLATGEELTPVIVFFAAFLLACMARAYLRTNEMKSVAIELQNQKSQLISQMDLMKLYPEEYRALNLDSVKEEITREIFRKIKESVKV
jgi:hypothetical protein